MKGLLHKPVLVVALITLATLVATEGSGETLSDLEDLDDDEGSGEWDILNQVEKKEYSEYDVHFTKLGKDEVNKQDASTTSLDVLEYYDDVYPEDYDKFLENYDEDTDDYDYSNSKTNKTDKDSVLKIEDKGESDIEIRPKPGSEEGEDIVLETSQIFIMVGSAFVSFAIVMLSFFLCRRMMAKKQEKKRIPFSLSPERKSIKESSIVKDYQKVPTSTKEFLQNSHIEMYRGEGGNPENPASAPLVP